MVVAGNKEFALVALMVRYLSEVLVALLRWPMATQ